MTISSSVDASQQVTLNGLIKANDWIFKQISKTLTKGLESLNVMTTGTDGTYVFADHNVRIALGEEKHDDLTLTTSIDIERKRLHVCLYRQEDMENFELPHMKELTEQVNSAFVKAGMITH
jgi:hypothetical protein